MDVVTEKESISNDVNLACEEESFDDNKPIIFDYNNITNIINIFEQYLKENKTLPLEPQNLQVMLNIIKDKKKIEVTNTLVYIYTYLHIVSYL